MNSKFKKTLLLFFAFVLLLGVTACNSKTDKNLNNSTEVKKQMYQFLIKTIQIQKIIRYLYIVELALKNL